jgi:hypothetical protein
MLNIESIFKYIHDQIAAGSHRYTLIDDEHVLDTESGVKLHLYDDWIKITYDDDVVAKMNDFTQSEQDILWGIKQMITDPEEAKQKIENYPLMLKKRREKLSELLENPKPVTSKDPVVEQGTEQYMG